MLNNILLVIFLSTALQANPLLTTYRNTGVIALEKQMDLELSKTEYWNKYIENIDTSFFFF